MEIWIFKVSENGYETQKYSPNEAEHSLTSSRLR